MYIHIINVYTYHRCIYMYMYIYKRTLNTFRSTSEGEERKVDMRAGVSGGRVGNIST